MTFGAPRVALRADTHELMPASPDRLQEGPLWVSPFTHPPTGLVWGPPQQQPSRSPQRVPRPTRQRAT
eukprot:14193764-Alexandrium_andersonii.AAC.1